MTDWQPIETAPKDGTIFLVFNRGVRGRHIHDVWCGTYLAEKQGLVAAGQFDGAPHLGWLPTHWMPLPDPPRP